MARIHILISGAVGLFVIIGLGMLAKWEPKKASNSDEDILLSEKLAEQICGDVVYKRTCARSLQTKGVNSSMGPQQWLEAGFQAAIDGLGVAMKEMEGSKDPNLGMAYGLCREYLQNSWHDLQRTLNRTNSLEKEDPVSVLDDIRLWLNGAVGQHRLCLTMLDESEVGSDINVRNILQPPWEMTVNGIGITNGFISKFLGPNEQEKVFEHILADSPYEHIIADESPHDHKILTVAKDGSGNFTNIGDALNAAPDNKWNITTVIYVKAGVYEEYVFVNELKQQITLIGDGMDKTKITGSKRNDLDGLGGPGPLIKGTTLDTATLHVVGNHFTCIGMTIENTAGPDVGPAVAVLMDSPRAVMYRCRILGYQDTLYSHRGSQVFKECIIAGTIDFIFGYGRAMIERSNIQVLAPHKKKPLVILAQGTRLEDKKPWGMIMIRNSSIIPEPYFDCNQKTEKWWKFWKWLTPREYICNYKAFLGRPWGNASTAIVLRSYLHAFIEQAGWMGWENSNHLDTCNLNDRLNCGPGARTWLERSQAGGVNRETTAFLDKITADSGYYIDYDYWNHWLQGNGDPEIGRRIDF